MLHAPWNIIIELKKMLFLKFYVENNFCYIIYYNNSSKVLFINWCIKHEDNSNKNAKKLFKYRCNYAIHKTYFSYCCHLGCDSMQSH
jgi:hypothetical protein